LLRSPSASPISNRELEAIGQCDSSANLFRSPTRICHNAIGAVLDGMQLTRFDRYSDWPNPRQPHNTFGLNHQRIPLLDGIVALSCVVSFASSIESVHGSPFKVVWSENQFTLKGIYSKPLFTIFSKY
jgi:hypothetical protein